jgi:hypothetical protein
MAIDDATPSHGWWCNSRTIPMRCRYCKDQVFYFTCDHGSKVFFDSLGWPWPEHHCPGYLASVYGVETIELALAARMMEPGYTTRGKMVEREYAEQVRQQSQRDRQARRELVDMEPPHRNSSHKDIGQIEDISNVVNVFKRFDVDPENPLGVALLGPLAKEPIQRIVIIVNDPDQQDLSCYKCYVAGSLLRKTGAMRGDVVHFAIRSIDTIGADRIWYCETLASPFSTKP